MTTSAFRLTFFAAFTSFVFTGPCFAFQETPNTTTQFLDSIGVAVHLSYFDTAYGNFPLVRQRLKELGIKHVRDGAQLINPSYNRRLYDTWIGLAEIGVRLCLVLDPRESLHEITPEKLETIDSLSGGGVIESFEGPNELDISGMPDWPATARNYQRLIWTTKMDTPGFAHLPVYGPAMAQASNAHKMGDLSAFVTEGNLHPYPGGRPPSVIFPSQPKMVSSAFPGRDLVFTETGYHNALADHRDQPAVTEAAAARYIPRIFLEDFNHGIKRTFLYELFDEKPDPGLQDNQQHYGLLRNDGTRKPSFIALRNLITILGRDSSRDVPIRALDYSLAKTTPELHHMLLLKSPGSYDLVLWQEVSSFDLNTRKDTEVSPANVTLNFNAQPQRVQIFDPRVSLAAGEDSGSRSEYSVEVADSPVIVEISMTAPAASPHSGAPAK